MRLPAIAVACWFLGAPATAAGPASGDDGEARRWNPSALRIKLDTPVGDAAEAKALCASIAAAVGADFLAARPVFPFRPRHEELARRFGLDRWIEITLRDVAEPEDQIARWLEHPGVEFCERISLPRPLSVPTDPLFPRQWEHDNTGSNPTVPPGTPDADMDTVEAWDVVLGDRLVILFESVSWYHPDLVGRVWQNLAEDLDQDGVLQWDSLAVRHVLDPDDLNGQDDDGNGVPDDLIGWNFLDGNPFPDGGASGHGTATAGYLVAESDNGIGVSGTCRDCRFLAVRSDIVVGLVYAADQGAQIASASFLEYETQAFRDALGYASALGLLLVAGAGNDASTEANPICANPNVLCVAATDQLDRIVSPQTTGGAWGTNYGPTVDVGAPGIYLTFVEDPGYGTGGGGTSAATPVAAGAAALVQTANPALTPGEVISILQSTTDPFVAADRFAGTGRINAKRAVDRATAAAAFGSHPVALIAPSPRIDLNGSLEIHGVATSPDFESYRIRVGVGLSPADWFAEEQLFQPVSEDVLYSLDVSSYPRLTEFCVELTVFDTNGQSALDVAHPVTKPNSFVEPPAWPIASSQPLHDPTFGDVDGDGTLELVVKGVDHYVYDLDADVLPGWPIAVPLSQRTPPVLVDLDADGDLEILAPHEESPGVSRMFAYQHDGSQCAGWPQALVALPFYYPVAGDLDGDGAVEIIQYAWWPQQFPTVHAFRTDGSALPGWPRTLAHDVVGAPVLADLDGDGDVELVMRSTSNVRALDEAGAVPPGWPLGDYATQALVTGDLDGDGTDEIVRPKLSTLYVNNADGTLRSGWPRVLSSDIGGLALGDVDGDGLPEILAKTAGDQFYILKEDGTVPEPWPLFFGPVAEFRSLADVDADGVLEIVYASGAEIHAVDSDGAPVQEWPIVVDQGDVTDVMLEDFDGDADLELFALVDLFPGPNTETAIHLFDLWGAKGADGWLLVNRDRTNSRRHVAAGPPVSAPAALLPGFAFDLPRPNPSSAQVRFGWTIPNRTEVTLEVFDVAGRLVRTLVRAELTPGEHSVIWDGNDAGGRRAGSGVYFARLTAPPSSSVRRIVGIRR
jgi:hypothetical protein